MTTCKGAHLSDLKRKMVYVGDPEGALSCRMRPTHRAVDSAKVAKRIKDAKAPSSSSVMGWLRARDLTACAAVLVDGNAHRVRVCKLAGNGPARHRVASQVLPDLGIASPATPP